jgi:hypothetical protein
LAKAVQQQEHEALQKPSKLFLPCARPVPAYRGKMIFADVVAKSVLGRTTLRCDKMIEAPWKPDGQRSTYQSMSI